MPVVEIINSQHRSVVHIGANLLQQIPTWIQGGRAFILADDALSDSAAQLKDVLTNAGWTCAVKFLPGREDSKSFETIYPIYDEMLSASMDRTSVLFALGGGVIGDIGGFLAGTYLRGIRWVCIPSTLLSQVDSAVGGKTGVNHPRGKNLIGVFHQPALVVCDVALLQTLTPREMISGLGEIIKYGLIEDSAFFAWVQKYAQLILNKDPQTLETTVTRCVQKKGRFVEQDEFDRNGIRELLNFGHTFGHALEAATHYNYFRHGEAVIWGIRAACFLSHQMEFLPLTIFKQIDTFLAQFIIPSVPADLSFDAFSQAMYMDKKKSQEHIRFILLRNIGEPILCHNVSNKLLIEAFKYIKTMSAHL